MLILIDRYFLSKNPISVTKQIGSKLKPASQRDEMGLYFSDAAQHVIDHAGSHLCTMREVCIVNREYRCSSIPVCAHTVSASGSAECKGLT